LWHSTSASDLLPVSLPGPFGCLKGKCHNRSAKIRGRQVQKIAQRLSFYAGLGLITAATLMLQIV